MRAWLSLENIKDSDKVYSLQDKLFTEFDIVADDLTIDDLGNLETFENSKDLLARCLQSG